MRNRNWLDGLDSTGGDYAEFAKSYIPQFTQEQIEKRQEEYNRNAKPDYTKGDWQEKYRKGMMEAGRTDLERYFYNKYLPEYKKLQVLRNQLKEIQGK
jgi:hypothetical protein